MAEFLYSMPFGKYSFSLSALSHTNTYQIVECEFFLFLFLFISLHFVRVHCFSKKKFQYLQNMIARLQNIVIICLRWKNFQSLWIDASVGLVDQLHCKPIIPNRCHIITLMCQNTCFFGILAKKFNIREKNNNIYRTVLLKKVLKVLKFCFGAELFLDQNMCFDTLV